MFVGRVREAHRISNDDRGVSRGRVIDNASKGLETSTQALRIWGIRQRLQRRDDGPEVLATTTEASEEEYNPEVSTTIAEASAEEAE